LKRYRIRPASRLVGRVVVPGDKSIGHRAVLLSALADGRSRITGLSGGLDNAATLRAMTAMGVRSHEEGNALVVDGVGLHGLHMPAASLDCGNSGTTMRLLAGILSSQRFGSRLIGDASLTSRPMRRIVAPLRARGAHIAGVSGKKEGEVYPPLSIAPLLPEERLLGLEYEMPVASAQLKSCLLLSGLYAKGVTALSEPVLSRDHTERMLVALGVPLQTMGPMVVFDPADFSGHLPGFEWHVPGDFSSAAFLIAAALVVPESRITIEDVGTNPTRSGLLSALAPMGASVHVTPRGVAAGDEPTGVITAHAGALRPGRAAAEVLVRMIDEVPAFCVIAARAEGVSEVRDAEELRVKESDRIATMASVLAEFGVRCEELPDGMRITGRAGPLCAANVASRGDHRIAMAATLLALCADGESVVDDVECVETSFPGFASLLRSLGAAIDQESAP
jgi:3-phosphoshikimate 1-carboxyvinyltransferase